MSEPEERVPSEEGEFVDNRSSHLVSAEEVLGSMPKETLKSLLYMAAGRPDSNYRSFRIPIMTSAEDVHDLDVRIREKLAHYDSASTVSVDIMYEKGRALHFGTWAEFQDHNWDNSRVTKSVTIRWDFMFTMPNYTIPQRHTLTVKLISGLDPLHVLQALTSKDPEDLTALEYEAAPIIARVDFISHLLGDELLNIVEEWVRSRPKAVFREGWRRWMRKMRGWLARCLHYSIPGVTALVVAGVLHWHGSMYSRSEPITIEIVQKALYWILLLMVSLPVTYTLGRYLAARAYHALEAYGDHFLFCFTSGDQNKHKTVQGHNRKALSRVAISSLIAILLNIIGAAVAWFLFSW
jgi:hypothetical protein